MTQDSDPTQANDITIALVRPRIDAVRRRQRESTFRFLRRASILLVLWAIVRLLPVSLARSAIDSRYAEWRQAYVRKDYDKAYSFMTQAYREENYLAQFIEHYEFLQYEPDEHREIGVGLLCHTAWFFNGDGREVFWGGPIIELRRIGGSWYFDEYEMSLD